MAATFEQRMRVIGTQFADASIDHAQARQAVLALIQEQFQCSRVSYWSLAGPPGERVAQCVVAHGVPSAMHVSGQQLLETNLPDYFKALAERRLYVCTDTLLERHWFPLKKMAGVVGTARSVIHAACAANGKLIGVLCCEQVDEPRQWTQRELLAALRIAAGLSLYIARITAETTALDPN
jgi:GAF domain-containing protein